MENFLSKWKWQIFALVIVLSLGCLFLLISGLGWTIHRFQQTPSPTVEPKTFGYCGADLTELCVVSFGRDVYGNTIVNLYVPLIKYPAFYLNIVRPSGAGRYECAWNKDVRTSVYCTGAAINLGEGFKIEVYSNKGDRLVAQGDFTLNAFLVTTPLTTLTPTPEVFENITVTPTSTPASSSYPSYP